MKTTRPHSAENLAEIVSVEQGALQIPESDTSEDDGLHIADSGGRIAVVCRANAGPVEKCRPAELSVTCSHSGLPDDALLLAVSLQNFLTGAYDLIGTADLFGGKPRMSRFPIRLDARRAFAGPRGEVRIKLSFTRGALPAPIGGFTCALHSVMLSMPEVDPEDAVVRTDSNRRDRF